MNHRVLFILCALVCAISAYKAPLPSLIRYEAEDAHLIGGNKAKSLEGFSGTGFARFSANEELNRIIFVANIPADGDYPVTIRHSSSRGATLRLFANGHHFGKRNLATSFEGWTIQKEMMTLRAGINSLVFENDGLLEGESVSIDFITIEGAAPLAGRGATTNYVEIEAEDASFNGKLIGPDIAYTHLAAEASRRVAVQLSDKSQWVEFTATASFNAFVVRYSIPDAPQGQGQNATLSYSVNGAFKADIPVTSHFAYSYGGYPFNKNPGSGTPHHYFDDVRVLLDSSLPAGTKLRFQGATDNIVFTIDLVDLYNVPAPYTAPADFLSVVDYGADGTGIKDSTSAFQQGIQAATQQNKGLWIPRGTYSVNQRFTVAKITIRGAGPWYSVVKATQNHGVGFFANWATNNNPPFQIYDFAIIGDTNDRDDGAIDSGVGGAPNNCIAQNIWIEHTKCGMWLDGPSSGFSVIGITVRNIFADGINLHIGFTNTVVQQSIFRNTGDDGLAMWGQNQANSKNTFKFNTITQVILASGISLYGGSDNEVTDNIVEDTLCEGAGLQVANRFGAIRLSGVTNFLRNTVNRGGGMSHDNASWNGAFWTWNQDSPIDAAVNIADTEFINSSFAGILFWGNSINNMVFTNVTIKGSGTYSIEAQGGFQNSVISMTGVVASDAKFAPFCNYANPQSGFQIKQGEGNSGWNTTSACRPPF